MENTEYYTELTGDFMESQCMQDLRNGKIIITDVPFKFKDSNAYSSAHKFARGIVDEKERCWRLWKLMECLESDIANIRIAQEIKEYGRTHAQLSEEIPEEDEFFNIDNRELDLTEAHRFYFEFATRKL